MSSLDRLEALISQRDLADAGVSKWSVGKQIHHCLKATESIAAAVADSQPGKEKPSFSFLRTVVMTLGRIPRGKGKAPAGSMPSESPTEDELRSALDAARQQLARAEKAEATSYWRHFKFGVMNRDTVLKFIEIHNNHHLRIVDDILKAA